MDAETMSEPTSCPRCGKRDKVHATETACRTYLLGLVVELEERNRMLRQALDAAGIKLELLLGGGRQRLASIEEQVQVLRALRGEE